MLHDLSGGERDGHNLGSSIAVQQLGRNILSFAYEALPSPQAR